MEWEEEEFEEILKSVSTVEANSRVHNFSRVYGMVYWNRRRF